MAMRVTVTLCTTELCEQTALSEQDLMDMVDHGIVQPRDPGASEWQFDEQVIADISRAVRLRQDLQINWAGVALALELLDEVQALRRENRALLQRLQRFEE